MTARRRVVLRAVRDGAVIAGLLFTAYLFVVVAPRQGTVGFDAFAYWSVDPSDPYTVAPGGLGAFNYAPPIAWLFGFFGSLEWLTFLWLWLAVLVGTVIFLGRRGYRVIWLLAFPAVALDLYHGNIDLLIAAAVALGFWHPWTWSFVLLTKVTPGVGLLWFAVRREWGSLGIAVGVTASIVAISLVVEPQLWQEWFAFLRDAQSGGTVEQFQIAIPLWARLAGAAALVTWGARTDRRWTVVLAATIGLPILWPSGFAICAALAHSAMRPSDAPAASEAPEVR